jgi:hypothetical protein
MTIHILIGADAQEKLFFFVREFLRRPVPACRGTGAYPVNTIVTGEMLYDAGGLTSELHNRLTLVGISERI